MIQDTDLTSPQAHPAIRQTSSSKLFKPANKSVHYQWNKLQAGSDPKKGDQFATFAWNKVIHTCHVFHRSLTPQNLELEIYCNKSRQPNNQEQNINLLESTLLII